MCSVTFIGCVLFSLQYCTKTNAYFRQIQFANFLVAHEIEGCGDGFYEGLRLIFILSNKVDTEEKKANKNRHFINELFTLFLLQIQ